jgi:ribosomal protein L12E/L44/L45/RPP1/RPP2
MSVIEAVAQENFVIRLAGHLREHYAAAAVTLPPDRKTTVAELPEDKLHALVRTGIARSRDHGIDLESSTAGFVAVMFEVAPNFDTHRLSQLLLNDEEVEPNERINELLKVLTEKNLESIRADYDPAAWEPAAENAAEEAQAEENKVAESQAQNKAQPGDDLDKTVFNY